MKMKHLSKIMALAVMAIFMLSIPAALADEVVELENETEDTTFGNGKPLKENKPFAEKLKDLEGKTYQQLKEKHQQAKETYEEQKGKVFQVQNEIKACKNDSETCLAKKTQLKVGVQQHLVKTVELIQKSMDRFTKKVEESKTLTEEEKTATLALIQENNDKLNLEIEKLNALSENATNEELKEAIKEVKQLWQDTNKIERYALSQLVSNKLENVVEKHDEYYNAMLMRIKTLSDAGQNVDELNALAEKFKAASDQLKADEELAKEKWLIAKSEKTKETLEVAQTAQKTVRDDLKKTKELLREFLLQFKEQNKELKQTTTTEENETEETETEETETEEPVTENTTSEE